LSRPSPVAAAGGIPHPQLDHGPQAGREVDVDFLAGIEVARLDRPVLHHDPPVSQHRAVGEVEADDSFGADEPVRNGYAVEADVDDLEKLRGLTALSPVFRTPASGELTGSVPSAGDRPG